MKHSTLLFTLVLIMLCIHDTRVTATEVVRYEYDAMQRLILVESEKGKSTKTYDALGNRLTETRHTSTITNQAPLHPTYTSPSDSAKGLSQQNINLIWTAKDPDPGDKLTYSVYFGEESTPPLRTSGLNSATHTITSLKPHTTYYWKIAAKDRYNEISEGPVWSFTTSNTPPGAVASPYPTDRAIVTSQSCYLDWKPALSTPEDPINYSLLFGTTPTPQVKASKLEKPGYSLEELAPGTTYYWQVITVDSFGAETKGPLWTFTTSKKPPQIIKSITYSSNTTLTKADGPYIISGDVIVPAKTTLTIEPGTLIKLSSSSQFIVHGNLVAVGTQDAPIIITSASDDTYGGDTNGDGRKTLPLPGDWHSIKIHPGGKGEFNHCRVLYGGSFKGPIVVDQGTLTVKNSLIKDSNSNGVRLIKSVASTIENNTIIGSNRCGIWVSESSSSKANIANNTIKGSADIGIYIDSGNPKITTNTVKNNTNHDLKLTYKAKSVIVKGNIFEGSVYIPEDSVAEFTNNTIICDKYHTTGLYPNLLTENNGDNTITFTSKNVNIHVLGGTLSKDAVWKKDVTYIVTGTITVLGDDSADKVTTLTIEPGTKILFTNSGGIVIGDTDGLPGRLIAEGTKEASILFSSDKGKHSDWSGIQFLSTSSDFSIMKHCIIEYGGRSSSSGNLSIENASPKIADTIIRHSRNHGIKIYKGSPEFTNVTIENSRKNGILSKRKAIPSIITSRISKSGSSGIYVYSGSISLRNTTISESGKYGLYINKGTAKLTDNTINDGLFSSTDPFEEFTGNSIHQGSHPLRFPADNVGGLNKDNSISFPPQKGVIEVSGGKITHDTIWKKLSMPYNIQGSLTVGGTDGADGITSLTIEPGVTLAFQQKTELNIGTSSGPPGALLASGTSGAPITFTTATQPAKPGDWYGIYINPSTSNVSRLHNCIIEFAGYHKTGGNVNIDDSSPEISNTVIRRGKTNGIKIRKGSPTITNSIIRENGTNGVFIQKKGQPIITNNSIIENGGCAITSENPSFFINAQNNWWGDSSGPLDSSDDRKKDGLFNPKGKGACVSDYVDYKPWAKKAPVSTGNSGK